MQNKGLSEGGRVEEEGEGRAGGLTGGVFFLIWAEVGKEGVN